MPSREREGDSGERGVLVICIVICVASFLALPAWATYHTIKGDYVENGCHGTRYDGNPWHFCCYPADSEVPLAERDNRTPECPPGP